MIAAPQRITEFRLPSGRLVFALLLVLIALVAALVTLEKRQQSAPSSVTTRAAATVTGAVVIDGGFVPEGRSDFHPARSVRLVIVGVTAAGARITRHLRTDVAGHFSLNLEPGGYTVTALAFGPATRPLSTQPHTRVTVTPGHPVAIRITGHVH
jgi:hypothetical protein